MAVEGDYHRLLSDVVSHFVESVYEELMSLVYAVEETYSSRKDALCSNGLMLLKCLCP